MMTSTVFFICSMVHKTNDHTHAQIITHNKGELNICSSIITLYVKEG